MNLCRMSIKDFILQRKRGKYHGKLFEGRHKETDFKFLIYQMYYQYQNTERIMNDFVFNTIVSGSFIQPFLGYDVKLSKDGSIKDLYLFYSEPKYKLEDFVSRDIFNGDSRLYNTTRMKIILGIAKFLEVTGKLGIWHSFLCLNSIYLSECMEPKILANSLTDLFTSLYFQYIWSERNITDNENMIFCPPEIIKDDRIAPNEESNVYSFGSFLYFLFISKKSIQKQFSNFNDYCSFVVYGHRLNNIKNKIPSCFWEMIEDCWGACPEDRPTFNELINTLLNQDEFHTDVDMEEVRSYYEKLELSLQRTKEFMNNHQFCSTYLEILNKYCFSDEHINYNSLLTDPLFHFNNETNQIENNKEIEDWKKEKEDLMTKLNYFFTKEKKKEDKEKIKYLSVYELNENYKVVDRITIGGTSEILKIEKSKIYARKMMTSTDSTNESFRNMIKEFDLLVNINHPCIIKVEGINTGDEDTPPSIIMKYEPFSLKDKRLLTGIRYYEDEEEKKTINEFNTSIVIIIIEIIIGMRFIHWMNIIHRDLNPANILITKDKHCKICDFGLSTVEDISTVKKTGGVGTLEYMAPEMLNEEEIYSNKIDCYSFGVLLYYIVSKGETPEIKMKEVMNGKKAKIPYYFTKLSKEIIKECWNFDPKERPSFEDILRKIKERNYEILEGIDVKRIEERIQFIEGFERIHPQEAI